ncbi:uncharacterized protein LOC118753016 [Rhagoletis pomonella]|uniref:uncharacterized protein LOC118753016 n=1 Tax=Rhagoletis pomonella TaxID=28610 RepID=UPI001785557A|nr:uncharacterized protein LOC118753016 [Rhagoletis pomonella]
MGKCALCFKRVQRGTGPFFQVPSQESIRLLWGQKCGIQFKVRDVVCVDHFSRSDMICGAKRSTLLPKAIPIPPSQCATSSNWTPSDNRKLFTESCYAELESDISTSSSQSPEILDSGISSQASSSSFLTDGTDKLVKGCQMLIDSYLSLTAVTKKNAKDCHTQTEPTIREAPMEKEIFDLKREVKKIEGGKQGLGSSVEYSECCAK